MSQNQLNFRRIRRFIRIHDNVNFNYSPNNSVSFPLFPGSIQDYLRFKNKEIYVDIDNEDMESYIFKQLTRISKFIDHRLLKPRLTHAFQKVRSVGAVKGKKVLNKRFQEGLLAARKKIAKWGVIDFEEEKFELDELVEEKELATKHFADAIRNCLRIQKAIMRFPNSLIEAEEEVGQELADLQEEFAEAQENRTTMSEILGVKCNDYVTFIAGLKDRNRELAKLMIVEEIYVRLLRKLRSIDIQKLQDAKAVREILFAYALRLRDPRLFDPRDDETEVEI
jgi:hypothetical protein